MLKFSIGSKVKMSIATMVLCSIGASAQTLTTLHNFGAPKDGIDPLPSVAFDKSGNVYGTTTGGGNSGAGTAFQLSPPETSGASWTETIVHNFIGKPDGSVPESHLIVSASDAIVGTTYTGGSRNMGSVFVANPPSSPGNPWSERVIYSFGAIRGDGINPNAGLLPAHPGYFGVTFAGGTNNMGTVFKLSPPSSAGAPWTESILYSFKGSGDAAFPSSELIADQSGNLYGTTTLGGASNSGAVYELSPAAGGGYTETVIYSFSGPDGTLPAGKLQLDASGVLYGTTAGGGASGEGTVFQLTPGLPGASWTESVLYSFSGGSPDGGEPSGGVVLGKRGQLYGTAAHGGSHGAGVVFELDPPSLGGGWTQQVLYAFNSSDGFAPESGLVLRQGQAFGTTTQGGLFGAGTVFALTLP